MQALNNVGTVGNFNTTVNNRVVFLPYIVFNASFALGPARGNITIGNDTSLAYDVSAPFV